MSFFQLVGGLLAAGNALLSTVESVFRCLSDVVFEHVEVDEEFLLSESRERVGAVCVAFFLFSVRSSP